MTRKPFWFLHRINSFQNQNVYQHNISLIINDSPLHKNKNRNTSWQNRQLSSKKCKFDLRVQFTTLLKTFVVVCAYDSLPLLKGPDLPCDVMMMPICDVHETGCIFEYIFWTPTHWPIDINKDNSFQELFERFWVLGLSFLFSLATCSNYSIKNYIKIPVLYFCCCCCCWKDE